MTDDPKSPEEIARAIRATGRSAALMAFAVLALVGVSLFFNLRSPDKLTAEVVVVFALPPTILALSIWAGHTLGFSKPVIGATGIFGGLAFAVSSEHIYAEAIVLGASQFQAVVTVLLVDGVAVFLTAGYLVLVGRRRALESQADQTGTRKKRERRPVTARPSPAGAASAVVPSGAGGGDRSASPTLVDVGTDDQIAALLTDNPGLSQKEIAGRIGKSTKTVARSDAWRNRQSLNGAAA